LSKVFFIATANYMDPIPPALRDRMEIIDLPGYTHRDKLRIAKKYLVPRQLEENGLSAGSLKFQDAALERIIEGYTREAGVRNLEREIGSVCRAIAAQIARDEKHVARITVQQVAKHLGPVKYESEMAQRTSVPGVVTGLAWTPVGGDILFVEATGFPGKGNLQLTGQIGDVMRESAQAAYSLARSRAKKLGIDPLSFGNHDLHLHVPAGAIPKDGPSAGVAMFTAIVSLLTNRPVRADVAMTGEITLRGMVLPIGGLKEKVLAAHRAGVKTVVFPSRNAKDLQEIPDDVRREIHFVPATRIDQVLEAALEPADGKRTAGKAGHAKKKTARRKAKTTKSRKTRRSGSRAKTAGRPRRRASAARR
jgi:ATP-dependent Lon protease